MWLVSLFFFLFFLQLGLSSLPFNDRNGIILKGKDTNDYSGYSVSSAGDFNNDGIADVIIGAPNANPMARSYGGEVYIVYGSLNLNSFILDSLDGSNGFLLRGVSEYDQTGYSVSNAGDFNGDGIDDVIIGAHGANNNAGVSYILYGTNNIAQFGIYDLTDLNSETGIIIKGVTDNDFSGRTVAYAGDFNGDGYDDVVIGAMMAGSSNRGDTYILYGFANSTGVFNLSSLYDQNGEYGIIIHGIDNYDNSGECVHTAGDFNGDGFSDIMIGAYEANYPYGEAYLLFGGSTENYDFEFNLSSIIEQTDNCLLGLAFQGNNYFEKAGGSVGTAGDFNGDGFDDIIIGGSMGGTGNVYLIYGSNDPYNLTGTNCTVNLSLLNGENGFVFKGIDAGEATGYSISGAGDINDDGFDDVIIGANGGNGKAFVIYGGTNIAPNGIFELSSIDGNNGFVFAKSFDDNDSAGRSVSDAGDVNNDGYPDVIIGANKADRDSRVDAGESYILYGPKWIPASSAFTIMFSFPLVISLAVFIIFF